MLRVLRRRMPRGEHRAAAEAGAATVFARVVAGQLITAMVIDQLTLLGVRQQPFGPGRALGVVLLLAGVLLIRR